MTTHRLAPIVVRRPIPRIARPQSTAGKLFGDRHVALAALLGGPLAGFLLVAHNARQLGQHRRAALSALTGFAATAALVTGGLTLYLEWPIAAGAVVVIGLAEATRRHARSLYRLQVERHVELGGAVASLWEAAVVGLMVAASEMVIAITVLAQTTV